MKPQGIHKILVVGLFFLTILGCYLSFPHLRFSPSLDLNITTHTEFINIQAKEALFPQTDPLLLVWNSALVAPDINREIQASQLIKDLSALTNWEVWGSYNVGTQESSFNPSTYIQKGPYGALFYSPDRVLWKFYLQPKNSGKPDWLALEPLSQRPEIGLMGKSWMDRWVLNTMFSDLKILVPLSLVLLFLVFLFMTKNIRATPWLTLTGVVPALTSLIPFGLMDTPITFGTLVAPFLVLALSTTYGLHIWHHHEHHGFDSASLWKDRGRPMVWAGGTTFLGFLTLIISPVDELRMLGIVSLAGLSMVFIWSLGALPILLGWFVPLAKKVDENKNSLKAGRNPVKTVRWILVLVFIPALFWLPKVKMGMDWQDLFWPQDPQARALTWLQSHDDVVEPWVLLAEGPVEEFWWQPESFNALETWRAEGSKSDQGILDYTQILNTLWKTWETGNLKELGSELTPEILAELSEMVPRSAGLPPVIDGTGRNSLIYFFSDPKGGQSPSEYLNSMSVNLGQQFPQVKFTWIGQRVRRTLGEQAYAQGQVMGLALYFALIGVVILFGVHRHRRLIWVMLVPLSSILFLLGLSAALGWRITPALSLVLATVAGVSVDDAFLWAFMGSVKSIRKTVVQSSLLLGLLLIPLSLSSFFNLFQVAILTMVAFAFSTSVVLFVLPWKHNESS